MEVSDPNYENLHISGNEHDINVLKHIISQFDSDIFAFQKSVGAYLDAPIKIRIAANEKEYHSWTGGNSAILEFSQAFYNRNTDTIYLRNPSELKNLTLLRRILLHEYIHHFVSHYWKNPPLWFNEGMAVFFSSDMGFERELNFAKNYILGNSRTLNMMKYSYPRNQIEWESFYAKSGLAVKYIYLKKKIEFYRFWDLAKPEHDFDSAFLKAFLMSTEEFSTYFENYAKTHFRVEILLASTGMIWSILPLVLIAGVIRRKFINRKKLKVWEKEEESEKTDIVSNSAILPATSKPGGDGSEVEGTESKIE